MECLYCGSREGGSHPDIHICICGRSGNWSKGYSPKLIECAAQFDTPDWLRTLRRLRFTARPVNGPIIEAAIRSRAPLPTLVDGFLCAACGRRFEQARLTCMDGCDGSVYRAPNLSPTIVEAGGKG